MYEDLLGEREEEKEKEIHICAWEENTHKCRDYNPYDNSIHGCAHNSDGVCEIESDDSLITMEED